MRKILLIALLGIVFTTIASGGAIAGEIEVEGPDVVNDTDVKEYQVNFSNVDFSLVEAENISWSVEEADSSNIFIEETEVLQAEEDSSQIRFVLEAWEGDFANVIASVEYDNETYIDQQQVYVKEQDGERDVSHKMDIHMTPGNQSEFTIWHLNPHSQVWDDPIIAYSEVTDDNTLMRTSVKNVDRNNVSHVDIFRDGEPLEVATYGPSFPSGYGEIFGEEQFQEEFWGSTNPDWDILYDNSGNWNYDSELVRNFERVTGEDFGDVWEDEISKTFPYAWIDEDDTLHIWTYSESDGTDRDDGVLMARPQTDPTFCDGVGFDIDEDGNIVGIDNEEAFVSCDESDVIEQLNLTGEFDNITEENGTHIITTDRSIDSALGFVGTETYTEITYDIIVDVDGNSARIEDEYVTLPGVSNETSQFRLSNEEFMIKRVNETSGEEWGVENPGGTYSIVYDFEGAGERITQMSNPRVYGAEKPGDVEFTITNVRTNVVDGYSGGEIIQNPFTGGLPASSQFDGELDVTNDIHQDQEFNGSALIENLQTESVDGDFYIAIEGEDDNPHYIGQAGQYTFSSNEEQEITFTANDGSLGTLEGYEDGMYSIFIVSDKSGTSPDNPDFDPHWIDYELVLLGDSGYQGPGNIQDSPLEGEIEMPNRVGVNEDVDANITAIAEDDAYDGNITFTVGNEQNPIYETTESINLSEGQSVIYFLSFNSSDTPGDFVVSLSDDSNYVKFDNLTIYDSEVAEDSEDFIAEDIQHPDQLIVDESVNTSATIQWDGSGFEDNETTKVGVSIFDFDTGQHNLISETQNITFESEDEEILVEFNDQVPSGLDIDSGDIYIVEESEGELLALGKGNTALYVEEVSEFVLEDINHPERYEQGDPADATATIGWSGPHFDGTTSATVEFALVSTQSTTIETKQIELESPDDQVDVTFTGDITVADGIYTPTIYQGDGSLIGTSSKVSVFEDGLVGPQPWDYTESQDVDAIFGDFDLHPDEIVDIPVTYFSDEELERDVRLVLTQFDGEGVTEIAQENSVTINQSGNEVVFEGDLHGVDEGIYTLFAMERDEDEWKWVEQSVEVVAPSFDWDASEQSLLNFTESERLDAELDLPATLYISEEYTFNEKIENQIGEDVNTELKLSFFDLDELDETVGVQRHDQTVPVDGANVTLPIGHDGNVEDITIGQMPERPSGYVVALLEENNGEWYGVDTELVSVLDQPSEVGEIDPDEYDFDTRVSYIEDVEWLEGGTIIEEQTNGVTVEFDNEIYGFNNISYLDNEDIVNVDGDGFAVVGDDGEIDVDATLQLLNNSEVVVSEDIRRDIAVGELFGGTNPDDVNLEARYITDVVYVTEIDGVEYITRETPDGNVTNPISEIDPVEEDTIDNPWANIPDDYSSIKWQICGVDVERPGGEGEKNVFAVGDGYFVELHPNNITIEDRTGDTVSVEEYNYPSTHYANDESLDKDSVRVNITDEDSILLHPDGVFVEGCAWVVDDGTGVELPGVGDGDFVQQPNNYYLEVPMEIGAVGLVNEYLVDDLEDKDVVSGFIVDPIIGDVTVTIHEVNRGASDDFGELVSEFTVEDGQETVEYTIHNLTPERNYTIYEDGIEYQTQVADGDGSVTFTKTEGWEDEHEYVVVTGDEADSELSVGEDASGFFSGININTPSLVLLAILGIMLGVAGYLYRRGPD